MFFPALIKSSCILTLTRKRHLPWPLIVFWAKQSPPRVCYHPRTHHLSALLRHPILTGPVLLRRGQLVAMSRVKRKKGSMSPKIFLKVSFVDVSFFVSGHALGVVGMFVCHLMLHCCLPLQRHVHASCPFWACRSHSTTEIVAVITLSTLSWLTDSQQPAAWNAASHAVRLLVSPRLCCRAGRGVTRLDGARNPHVSTCGHSETNLRLFGAGKLCPTFPSIVTPLRAGRTWFETGVFFPGELPGLRLQGSKPCCHAEVDVTVHLPKDGCQRLSGKVDL